MELRQMRYFVRVVELGSMGRAALDLGVVVSALSQQISRLEGELATRLLSRSRSGVIPTEAGLAFFAQAQLALRHADDAVRAAQQERLSGHVSVGLAPTTCAVLGLPLMQAMRQRYPEVRLHLVESLSGYLSSMLNHRALDLAVLFRAEDARRWSVLPLLSERLFVIASTALPGFPAGGRIKLASLAGLPLVLPTGSHGLRATVDAAFAAAKTSPRLEAEIDSLPLLMDAVRAGLCATVQPGAAIARVDATHLRIREVADRLAVRHNLLVSVSDNELSPAALATRVVVTEVARELVQQGRWPGATLHNS
jgi:LysR family transcriptional regulator, regulatory protein for tcuABC